MTLPGSVQKVLIQMYEKFGQLNHGSDDDRRKWTRMTCEQLVYTFGEGSGWGHKASGPNNPPSKDGIARKTSDGFFGWDVINGATRELIPEGQFHDLTGQYFIKVPPVDHLAGATPNPEPPQIPTDCQCKDSIGKLESEIGRLGQIVAAQTEAFAQLAKQMAQVEATVSRPKQIVGRVNAKFFSGGSITADIVDGE
jgi:hypothetical protein